METINVSGMLKRSVRFECINVDCKCMITRIIDSDSGIRHTACVSCGCEQSIEYASDSLNYFVSPKTPQVYSMPPDSVYEPTKDETPEVTQRRSRGHKDEAITSIEARVKWFEGVIRRINTSALLSMKSMSNSSKELAAMLHIDTTMQPKNPDDYKLFPTNNSCVVKTKYKRYDKGQPI